MRPDARLQRPHAALRLGFDVSLPLMGHVEITECDASRDGADGEVAEQHLQVRAAERRLLDAERAIRVVREPRGALGYDRGDRERDRERNGGSGEHVEPRQQPPRGAPERGRAERGPQEEQRDLRELGPETRRDAVAREREEERDERRDQDHCEHALRAAEIGEVEARPLSHWNPDPGTAAP